MNQLPPCPLCGSAPTMSTNDGHQTLGCSKCNITYKNPKAASIYKKSMYGEALDPWTPAHAAAGSSGSYSGSTKTTSQQYDRTSAQTSMYGSALNRKT